MTALDRAALQAWVDYKTAEEATTTLRDIGANADEVSRFGALAAALFGAWRTLCKEATEAG